MITASARAASSGPMGTPKPSHRATPTTTKIQTAQTQRADHRPEEDDEPRGGVRGRSPPSDPRPGPARFCRLGPRAPEDDREPHVRRPPDEQEPGHLVGAGVLDEGGHRVVAASRERICLEDVGQGKRDRPEDEREERTLCSAGGSATPCAWPPPMLWESAASLTGSITQPITLAAPARERDEDIFERHGHDRNVPKSRSKASRAASMTSGTRSRAEPQCTVRWREPFSAFLVRERADWASRFAQRSARHWPSPAPDTPRGDYLCCAQPRASGCWGACRIGRTTLP